MEGLRLAWLRFTWVDLVDILVVTAAIYKLISLIRHTRVVSLLRGLLMIFVAAALARWLGLRAVGWLLDRAMTGVLVALPIVFYPELRRGLEQLGRGDFLGRTLLPRRREEALPVVRAVARAAGAMSALHQGALIVFERRTGLEEYAEGGVPLDARVTTELLLNLFHPHTPLHDGAVIVRGQRLVAAACFVPLTENPALPKEIGSRHRAALGISEVSDAVAVVVSEETGAISLAVDGVLERGLDEKALQRRLLELEVASPTLEPWWQWK